MIGERPTGVRLPHGSRPPRPRATRADGRCPTGFPAGGATGQPTGTVGAPVPPPPAKGFFVPAVLKRLGVRSFAVAMLLVGLLGGVALGVNRQTQAASDREYRAALQEQDELRDLKAQQDAYRKATAGQRDAQSDAQSKANAAAATAAALAASADAAARSSGASRGGTRPTYGPIPSSCSEYTGNRAIGCALLLQWGFGLDQMACLEPLWTHESGWNEKAKNSSSGSYGIPQALPASKMAAYGSDYLTNPATQIKWGLDYIKNRYTTPCNAWTLWQERSPHWY